MLKEDFMKFNRIASDEINPEYKLQYLDGKQYRLIFSKKCPAFLDIYLYEQKENKIYSIPQFVTKSYNIGVEKDIVFPLSETVFENIKVKIPKDTDSYLKIRYGNWHVLPKHVHLEGGHNSTD